MTPTALVQLANLGRPRRPSRVSARMIESVLPDTATAARQLGGIVSLAIEKGDLAGLRHLHRFAVRASQAILQGELPRPDALNRLASEGAGHIRLISEDRVLRAQMSWQDSSVVSELARRLIHELATLEPTRLRRCARPQCGLVFYDATRSRTQRWHAEDPCGWRQRQQLRRARA